jgi:hypothetical protein
MTTVIGVFDHDSDLELALNRLYDKGFNDVRVVDRSRENWTNFQEGAYQPAVAATNTGTSQPGGIFPVPFLMPGFFGLADDTLTGSYFGEALGYSDMSDEETEFYANAVRKGGKLLIVETDDDHADSVWSVMRNSNASQYSKAD